MFQMGPKQRNKHKYNIFQVGQKQTNKHKYNMFQVGQQDIVLNCNYHFDSHEAEQLEVKWYFNKVGNML